MDADVWNHRYSTSELIWSGEPNRFLVAQPSNLLPGRALDLGAGEGRYAVWLATCGWDVVDDLAGTDLSVERADRVQCRVATDDREHTVTDALVRTRRHRR